MNLFIQAAELNRINRTWVYTPTLDSIFLAYSTHKVKTFLLENLGGMITMIILSGESSGLCSSTSEYTFVDKYYPLFILYSLTYIVLSPVKPFFISLKLTWVTSILLLQYLVLDLLKLEERM